MDNKIEKGQKAKSLWWNGVNGDRTEEPKEDEKFIYHWEYYGSHTENWILVIKNGKEIRRHNTQYIATIEWE